MSVHYELFMDQFETLVAENKYFTTDAGEAAVLFALKFQFLGFKKKDSEFQYYFVFEYDAQVPLLLAQYWEHTLMIDAKEVLWSFRTIKRRLSHHIQAQ